MGWNHRVLAHKDGEEMFLQIHEVYYNDEGVPDSYTANGVSVSGNSLEDLDWVLLCMNKCMDKPILLAGERFPEEYIEVKL